MSENKTENNEKTVSKEKPIGFLRKLKTAWQQREKLGDANQERELAAFLPAALEIQATPPHPLARWLTWSLIVLLVIGIVWACMGKVNIVASAEGKIIPSSRVKQIQPLEKAIIKNILVKEGQYVKQGDPLIELDNTLTFADQTRLESEVIMTERNLAVNGAFLALLALPEAQQKLLNFDQVMQDKTNADYLLYKKILWQQWQQYWSQKQALENALVRTDAERAAVKSEIKKLVQTLPVITQRAKKVKTLLVKNYASEDEYLTLEQERIVTEQDLVSERHRLKQLDASYKEIQQQMKTEAAQTKSEQLTKMAEYQRQLTTLNKEYTKASALNAKQILYAPVAGHIQELAANTIGGVVTEAQQLMLIVPDDEQLEVEVFLENKDIGFVREGMTAEIKIHTFPFTKYGIIDGEILTVSDDATLDDQRGLIYGMRLLMKQDTINVHGKPVKLIPGMSVTAEVQTGYRRIIEFFMAPLLRYKKEGLRER